MNVVRVLPSSVEVVHAGEPGHVVEIGSVQRLTLLLAHVPNGEPVQSMECMDGTRQQGTANFVVRSEPCESGGGGEKLVVDYAQI